MDKNEAQPTQNLIEIENIIGNAIVLKGGKLRKILLVSGINFDLKSEEEQNMIIGLFQNFLNGLNFTLQIFIHSRKLNIERYLDNLTAMQDKEPNELLRNQISEYREFIRAFVRDNAIMNKAFFVVVPYDALQLPDSGAAITNITKGLFGIFQKKGLQQPARVANPNLDQQKQLEQHIEQLNQRVNQVIAGLNQIDLRAIALNNDELTEFFYNLYNSESVEKRVANQSESEDPSFHTHGPGLGEKKDLPTALRFNKKDAQDKT